MAVDKGNHEYWDCRKKKRYSSEHEALRTAKKCTKERGTKLDVYYCNHCKGYHITKNYLYQPWRYGG